MVWTPPPRGRIIRQKFIVRPDLRANPKRLYVFGDNLKQHGMGGQAFHMRGEPNAVGIPTKRGPGMDEFDFFEDVDFEDTVFMYDIGLPFRQLRDHIDFSGDIVIPEDGVGTGLAELPTRAPRIFAYINALIAQLETGDYASIPVGHKAVQAEAWAKKRAAEQSEI